MRMAERASDKAPDLMGNLRASFVSLGVCLEWRVVPSMPEYEVSNRGGVRRAIPGRGVKAGKVLATPLDAAGYPTIGTRKYGPKRVHVLVAEAFIGPIPPGAEVHHIDGDRSRSVLANLEVLPSRLAHGERHRLVHLDRRRHGEDNPVIACACGCGETFLKFDRGGRPRRFVTGHNGRRGPLGQYRGEVMGSRG